jgi:cytochrome P450
MFPWLDTIFPRQAVVDDLNSLNTRYDRLLREKRSKPGTDILTYLLEDASLSQEELISNLSILLSAGHVSVRVLVLQVLTTFPGHDFWRPLYRGVLSFSGPEAAVLLA